MLFSPANVLAEVNPVSEKESGSENSTADGSSNCSNDQNKKSSIDQQTSDGKSGSSDYSSGGQTNSNYDNTSSTLTSGDPETGSPEIVNPDSFGDDSKTCSFSSNYNNSETQKSSNEDNIAGSSESLEQTPNPETSSCVLKNSNPQQKIETDGIEETGQSSAEQEEKDLETVPENTEDEEKQTDVNYEPDLLAKPTSSEMNTSNSGNSYIATVIPEDGKVVQQGEPTALTVKFIELGNTSLGSAQLFIPNSLEVDTGEEVEISTGWAYEWKDPVDNSTFSKVLSIWSTLEGNYLKGKEDSVSATFTVTASYNQTHHFDTKAWQEAELDSQGNGIGVSSDLSKVNNYFGQNTDTGQYELGYSQPKLNVFVDQPESGYRKGSVAGKQEIHLNEARSLKDNTLFVGLDDIRDNLNWHYVQVEEIELTDFLSLGGAGYNSGAGWEPVGSDSNRFYGSYYGNGYTIDGLRINGSLTDYVGFFGSIGKGSLINSITMQNVNISGKSIVGSLVGENRNGVIINSSAHGTVTATGSNAGGLVGRNNRVNRDDTNYGVISNCFTLVSVTGVNNVGGLVGNNMRNAVIINCSAGLDNNSNGLFVTGQNEIGGLVGYNDGYVNESYSLIDVNSLGPSGNNFGGLVGTNSTSGRLIKSYSKGNVSATGSNLVGGLAGSNYNKVNACHATGQVAGSQMVGGLIGCNLDLVENSYATGSVNSLANEMAKIGGLIGFNTYRGIVKYCFSHGAVTALNGNHVGGLVGSNSNKIINSYATGDVSGSLAVGGLVGYHAKLIENCYASGKVKSGMLTGGLVGFRTSTSIVNHSYFSDSNHINNIGTYLTDPEMLDISSFQGWSISDIDSIESTNHIWFIDNGNAYPFLWWQYKQDCDDDDGDGDNGSEGNDGNGDNPPDEDHDGPDNGDEQDGNGEDNDQDGSDDNGCQDGSEDNSDQDAPDDDDEDGSDVDSGQEEPDEEDDQDGSDDNGDQDEPGDNEHDGSGDNNHKSWPSFSLGIDFPGNTQPIYSGKSSPAAPEHQAEVLQFNQYLLVLLNAEMNSNLEVLVTPEFLKEGGWVDYFRCLVAYNNLLTLFDDNKEFISTQEYATLKIDLTIADAALKAVKARLFGIKTFYHHAIQAYETAMAAYIEHGSSLSEDHNYRATEILIFIESKLF